MEKQHTFDFAKARNARDTGIQRATDHANRVEPRWADTACAFLEGYAQRHELFTSEVVRLASAGHVPAPPDGRAWGGVFQRAARAGLLERAGFVQARDPKVHCNVVTEWRSRARRAA